MHQTVEFLSLPDSNSSVSPNIPSPSQTQATSLSHKSSTHEDLMSADDISIQSSNARRYAEIIPSWHDIFQFCELAMGWTIVRPSLDAPSKEGGAGE